jgi:hypothetical protein
MGQQDGRLRIRRRPFDSWFRERGINPRIILEGLKAYYMVLPSKTTIGAGVDGLDATSRIGQTSCYDLIPLPPSPGSDEPN